MTELKVAPVGHDAAKYACEHWHYSRTVPAGKLIKYGVWENDRFIGVILFGRGASQRMLTPYGLEQTGGCELTRIALTEHTAPVSQIAARTLTMLKASNPGLRLVISFADPKQNHHGGIYQAGNWVYTGKGDKQPIYIVKGARQHGRTNSALIEQLERRYRRNPGEGRIDYIRRVYDPTATQTTEPGKLRYLMPLDRAMRRRITPLAQPYPRGRSVDGDTPPLPGGEAGSTPADRSHPIRGGVDA